MDSQTWTADIWNEFWCKSETKHLKTNHAKTTSSGIWLDVDRPALTLSTPRNARSEGCKRDAGTARRSLTKLPLGQTNSNCHYAIRPSSFSKSYSLLLQDNSKPRRPQRGNKDLDQPNHADLELYIRIRRKRSPKHSSFTWSRKTKNREKRNTDKT